MTKENLPADEHFRKADPLYLNGEFCAEVWDGGTGQVLSFFDETLNAQEAREIRDWLNKVLP